MPLDRTDYTDASAPTYGKRTIRFPCPEISALIIDEQLEIRPENYQALPPNTPHPSNSVTGLDLRLCYQGPAKGNDASKAIRQIYAARRLNQNPWNYSQSYSGESKAHPVFTRSYIFFREDYQNEEAAGNPARNQPLKAVVAVTVTAQGHSYTDATTVTPGAGNATFKPIIYEGKIVAIQITAEGDNYTSAPTLIIVDSGGGSGAAATARIQPQTALLSREELQKLDDDPTLNSLFVRVIRIYTTLPGPVMNGASKTIPHRTPPKYIDSETATITRQNVPHGTSPDTVSGEGDSSVVTPQSTVEATKETTDSTLAVSARTEYKKTGDDQLITVVGSVGTDGTAPTIAATTEIAEVNALGGNQFERVIGTVPEVFDAKVVADSGGIAFPHLRHMEFLATPKAETVETTQAGTDTTPDALSANGLGITESRVSRAGELKTRKSNTVESGTPVPLNGWDYDEATGLLLPVTNEVVAAGSSGTALQTDGTYAEVSAFNPVWSLKTTRKATGLTTRTYTTSQHVTLPKVLTIFTPVAFENKDGFIRSASFYHELKDYSGVYVITVLETWASTPVSVTGGTNFRPTGFTWITPFGGGSVPECLHGAITITGTTGTDDPDWADITWTYAFSATSPASMPGTVILSDTQTPWRGGYLRRKETITVS